MLDTPQMFFKISWIPSCPFFLLSFSVCFCLSRSCLSVHAFLFFHEFFFLFLLCSSMATSPSSSSSNLFDISLFVLVPVHLELCLFLPYVLLSLLCRLVPFLPPPIDLLSVIVIVSYAFRRLCRRRLFIWPLSLPWLCISVIVSVTL